MRNVNELNQNELEELRSRLFHKLLDDGSLEEIVGDIESENQMSMSFVKDHYKDTLFTEDDFFCNEKQDLPTGIYTAKLNSFEIELADGTKINKVNQDIRIIVKNVSNFSFVFPK